MKLREFFALDEATPKKAGEGPEGSGVPEPLDPSHFVNNLPTKAYRGQAGAGPMSSGVPTPIGGGSSGPMNLGRFVRPRAGAKPAQGSAPGTPVPTARRGTPTMPLVNYQSPGMIQTSPTLNVDPSAPENQPQQPQGSFRQRQAAPTRQMGALKQQAPFQTQSSPPDAARAVHPWGQDEPLPDLPLEQAELAEMFGLDEMPRPKGTYSPALKAAIQWASQQQGEFNGRQMFQVFRQAGGQPNQPNDTRAYQSFSMLLKKLIAPQGRKPSPEMPLLITKQGTRDASYPTMYRWGAKPGVAGPTTPPATTPVARKPQTMSPTMADLDSDDDFADEEPTQRDIEPGQAASPPSDDSDLPDLDSDEFADDEAGFDDEEPTPRDPSIPSWMPSPEPGAYEGAEAAIGDLAQKGLGPKNPLWSDIARAKDAFEAIQIIRTKTGPSDFRKKILVAKAIFANLGKGWNE